MLEPQQASNPPDLLPEQLLQRFPVLQGAVHWEPLPGLGFSGAVLWQVRSAAGKFCLKRLPPSGPQAAHLAWIHAVLEHIQAQGVQEVVLPLPTQEGLRFVAYQGQLWELWPWAEGEADFHQRPSLARVQAALHTLARFHTASRTFQQPPVHGYPPVIRRRWEALQRMNHLAQGPLNWSACPAQLRQMLQRLWHLALPQVRPLLGQGPKMLALTTPLVPCLRDVWWAHVFFQGDRVRALIDFSAMGLDCPVGDVARLLGSLTWPTHPWWQAGLEAYTSLCPLADNHWQLLHWLDRSLIVAAVGTWVRRLCVLGEPLPTEKVLVRLSWLAKRLELMSAEDF